MISNDGMTRVLAGGTGVERAWLSAIVESSDDAIISKTLDGVVTSWNEGATRIFGYAPEEMIGQPIIRIIPVELRGEEEVILSKLKRGERIAHFETVRVAKDGHLIDISLTVSPVRDQAGNLIGASKVARNITERKKAEKTRQLLLNELNHRVKNTLASVQAIVQGTLRCTKDPAEFVNSFAGRIQSLARVHSLLSNSSWHGATLRELIRDQLMLAPADESRVTAWGPEAHLDAQTSLHMALMLHELATNSAKYGALSAPSGRVAVSWTIVDAVLNLQWVERGGPMVAAPSKRGFGTTLIEQSARSDGGKAQMLHDAEGITWQISLPLPGPDVYGASTVAERVKSLAATEAPSSPAKRPPLAGRRLLVIEDEPLVALDIVAGLEDAGAEILGPAGTERDALRLIDTEMADAALLDANLHGRPVDQVAAALARRRIPFVFVSGHSRDALPAGFAEAPLIGKPFSHRKLVEIVADLLQPASPLKQIKP